MANALAAKQLAALKAQMGASAGRALVNLGDASLAGQVGNLNIPSNVGGLVDEANKSGTSVLAQLLHAHQGNTQQIPAALAGRGFYRSGQTGYSLGEESRVFGQKQFNARQQTLDYLNGLYNNYLNAQFGIQQSQLSAEMSAYQAALANLGAYGYTGAPAPASEPIPSSAPAVSAQPTNTGWQAWNEYGR